MADIYQKRGDNFVKLDLGGGQTTEIRDTVLEVQNMVKEIQDSMTAAEDAAAEALRKAEEAKTTAGNAQTAADGAKTDAANAKTAADGAKGAADAAKTAADGAQGTADTANTAAGAAQTTADEAKALAQQALDAASQSGNNSGIPMTGHRGQPAGYQTITQQADDKQIAIDSGDMLFIRLYSGKKVITFQNVIGTATCAHKIIFFYADNAVTLSFVNVYKWVRGSTAPTSLPQYGFLVLEAWLIQNKWLVSIIS